MAKFLILSGFLPEICWEKVAKEIFFSCFRFYVWPGFWTVALCLISWRTTYKHSCQINYASNRQMLVKKSSKLSKTFIDIIERLLRNFFMAGLFTSRVFARNLLKESCRKNIFFIFRFDAWHEIRTRGFTSNKPIHYLVDYVDIENHQQYAISKCL